VPVATVSNVTFDSSAWKGAVDVTEQCLTTEHGVETWTWHGVPGAKVLATLDASTSYDPDGGGPSFYAWNNAALGTAKVVYLSLSAGTYHAVLTVQDDYFVSAVTQVKFTVRDLARKKAPEPCGFPTKLLHLPERIRRPDPGDPFRFRAVIRDFAVSEGPGIAVNPYTRGQVVQLAEVLGGRAAGEETFTRATRAALGRRAPVRDVSPDAAKTHPEAAKQ